MSQASTPSSFVPCSRNACREEAVITLSCNYMARRVSYVDLKSILEPDQFNLCAEHMRRFRPPVGWETEDLRSSGQASRTRAS
ncbi:MAG: DUF3499 family protein [Actinomycetota bacterium]